MSYNIASAFESFCNALRFSDSDLSTISSRYHYITKRINTDYWDSSSDSSHSLYVGSYGRDTEIFASDIDMLVQLPKETYDRFNAYSTNGQSALLQDVKAVLQKTYSRSALKADGQIISIPFSDGINFEVLPAFLCTDGTYLFPNSNYGGSWKTTDPKSEIDAINSLNNVCNKNLKRLCKMARAWKDANSVNIPGILIDTLAYRFLSSWEYRDKSFIYYDWMTRDFMEYLAEVPTDQTKWQTMGSGRYIYFYGSFQSAAHTAYVNAKKAIEAQENDEYMVSYWWRKVYGNKFPI